MTYGEKMKVIITGDFYPGHINNPDKKNVYGEFLKLFEDCDLFITNFEGSLFEGIPRAKQGIHLYIDPKYLELLKFNGETVCCLANNHSCDYGLQGLFRTIDKLYENGISTVGAYTVKRELIIEQLYFTKDFVVINSCEDEGGNNISKFDLNNILNQFKNHADKKKIIVLHGGNEGYPLPNPFQVEISTFLVDMGADIILWSHSHVPGAYEEYNGKMIYYGLGNFLFKNHFGDIGYFVEYDTDSNSQKIHGYKINDNGIVKYDIQPILDRLNDRDWSEAWTDFCKSKYQKYKNWLKDFIKNDKDIDLLNFFQCESHRRVVIDAIKKTNNFD